MAVSIASRSVLAAALPLAETFFKAETPLKIVRSIHLMLRRKTPTGCLLGVFLCLLVACGESASTVLAPPSDKGAPCASLTAPAAQSKERVEVAAVVDGDTLRLKDGRTVRVLGINAPEVGRRGQPGEPFSRVAANEARSFLKHSSRILLVPGQEREDRYGRLLAHVYRDDGASLEAHLLTQGLAFHSPVPPNLAQGDCYATLESEARQAKLGIWSDNGIAPVVGGEVDSGGYQRVRGQVTSVAFRRHWWIELDHRFTAVIQPADQSRFERSQVAAWQGKTVEIKGWVYAVNGELRMKLETPWVIRFIE